MSTDYEVRCVGCDQNFSMDNWGTPEQVQRLVDLAPHFAAIGKQAADLWLYGWDVCGSMFPEVTHFFAEHEGHELRVFDEYGREWTPRDVAWFDGVAAEAARAKGEAK